jgi:hypothetical protein
LPQVAELTLLMPPNAPRGTTVKRDGVELAAAKLGVPLAVDPGEHVVTTQAPGGPVTEVTVTLGKAEKQSVTLQVKDALGAPLNGPPDPGTALTKDAPQAVDGQLSGRRVGAYVAGGVGIAGLILGGVAGGMALGKRAVIKQNCNIGGDAAACNDEGLSAASDATALGIVSTVGFGAGVVGLGVGVALWLTEPARPKRVAAAPGPVGWMSAGVLSASQEGAIVGLRGRW